jgi:hypothetical protein
MIMLRMATLLVLTLMMAGCGRDQPNRELMRFQEPPEGSDAAAAPALDPEEVGRCRGRDGHPMSLRDTIDLLDLWLDVSWVRARDGAPRTEGFRPIEATGEAIVGWPRSTSGESRTPPAVFGGPEPMQLEVSPEGWMALERAGAAGDRVIFGMSSFSLPGVGTVAVLLPDGRVAAVGSCSYGMISSPLDDYGRHLGLSAADTLLLLLESTESFDDFVAWQVDRERGVPWQEQSPETRIADRELIPPEILAALEEVEISVPLVEWLRRLGRPICARSPQGWGSCFMTDLTGDHAPLNAFVAPGEDIELWMADLPGDPPRPMVADAVGPLAIVPYAPPTDKHYRQVTLAESPVTRSDPPTSAEDVRARVDRGERLFTAPEAP